MKKFKVVSDVMVVVAVALFALGIIISVLAATAEEAIFLTLVQLNATLIACAGVGVFMTFSKSDAARKVGNGLMVVAFITGVVCALTALMAISEAVDQVSGSGSTVTEFETGVSIGAIVVIVSAVFLLLKYAFMLVDYLINRNAAEAENPNEDLRIIRIKEWKRLMEEGIITEEEYEEKRVQLLGIKPKNK